MTEGLVFTVVGPDRPGIVERLAECIEAHGGNWEEGQFQRLSGQFTGLLRVGVDRALLDPLQEALEALPGMRVLFASELREPTRRRNQRKLSVELVGADRQGIVRQVGHVLAALDVNIRKLESWTERAPMSGEPIFHARALLDVPPAISEARLREGLEALANELMVELSFPEPTSNDEAAA